ncbi:hypothetical protein [Acidiphilium sp. PA]|uniref:hypothetical protein n=1 Tax=Acidiphilium sp. PA TaxID=2871705 RepID=UPI0038D05FDC
MAALLQFPVMLAAHADWSVDPRKRWICKARFDGVWSIGAPEPVAESATLLARLVSDAPHAPIALGVDFPLGLPRAYAARADIANFAAWLRRLRPDAALFEPCGSLDEVSLARPFYPGSSVTGAGQMARLAAALGLSDISALRRAVDRQTSRRPAGAALFWTMGANQCGKAALAAWRDCLIPGFAQKIPIAIWPYEGGFTDLLRPGGIALAETYPAEALVQLGLKRPRSKRRQSDRAGLALAIRAVMAGLGAIPTNSLAAMLDDGFGATADGEDRFDCLLGVLAVIRVIGGASDGIPDDPVIRAVEGWVLGQVDPPLVPPNASSAPIPHRPPHRARRSRRADPRQGGSG